MTVPKLNDRPGFKKRPAIIISNENHYKEYGKYICLAITSQEKRNDTVRYEHKMYKTTSTGLLYNDLPSIEVPTLIAAGSKVLSWISNSSL